MTTHALLSSSSSHRWLRCPGSVAFTKDMPNEGSVYTEEGTQAHYWAEQAAQKVFNPAGLFTQDMPTDQEMADGAAQYAKEIKRALDETKGELFFAETEYPLDLEPLTGEKGAKGTADCVFVKGTTLFVFDYKYGRGVKVNAQANTQLAMYALAARHDLEALLDIKTVKICIVQPRIGNFVGWTPSEKELSMFESNCKKLSALAMSLVGSSNETLIDHMNPSEETCRFCPGKATCPRLAEFTKQAVVDSFPTLPKEARHELDNVLVVPDTPDRLAKAFSVCDVIELWVKSVREAMFKRLKNGEQIDGYKLVAGRPGVRKWADEAEAERVLKSVKTIKDADRYTRKLISPTQAEKLVKQGLISDYYNEKLKGFVTRSEGAPTVAAASDPRPALKSVEDDFEKLEA